MNLLEGIIKDYFSSRPDPQALQKRVNDQMEAYEEREERRRRELSERANTVDEDGFVTVVNPHSQHNTNEKDVEPFEGLKNFYKFQTRQQKVNHLEEIKRKFEQDKIRLAQLRQNRLFEQQQK
jgi:ribosomal RNA-processing protein 7